jgi:hypothetical protein
MIKKYYTGIKIYVLMFMALNAISLKRILTFKNKKHNKKGIVFKLSLYIDKFYNWCLNVAFENSKTIVK